MTQGALGHTGAQGRARGFESVIARHPNIEVLATDPADWDPATVRRLWESYLDAYPRISAAFFHNDDMALAALEVIRARGRTEIVVGGVDAMPPAIHAVLDGGMHATVRNSSCRIHGGAIVAGVEAALAPKKNPAAPPKQIIIDGPVVTPANAPGLLWMEDHFLIRVCPTTAFALDHDHERRLSLIWVVIPNLDGRSRSIRSRTLLYFIAGVDRPSSVA